MEDPGAFHRRRLAEEMKDPEFAREYEQARREIEHTQKYMEERYGQAHT
jgi:hypothetical protein